VGLVSSAFAMGSFPFAVEEASEAAANAAPAPTICRRDIEPSALLAIRFSVSRARATAGGAECFYAMVEAGQPIHRGMERPGFVKRSPRACAICFRVEQVPASFPAKKAVGLGHGRGSCHSIILI
jgi:hypothetical protein